MKKFVGNVNGKTFDNEKDFNIAATNAILSNDGTLLVSSYYVNDFDSNDKELINKEVEVEVTNIVPVEDIKISDDAKPRAKTNKAFEYVVPESLVVKLENASNKKELEEYAKTFISDLDNKIEKSKKSSHELSNKIESLQDDLYNVEVCLKEDEAKSAYYKSIIDIVGDNDLNDDEEDDEYNEDYEKDVDFLDFSDTSLLDVIKRFGFLD